MVVGSDRSSGISREEKWRKCGELKVGVSYKKCDCSVYAPLPGLGTFDNLNEMEGAALTGRETLPSPSTNHLSIRNI